MSNLLNANLRRLLKNKYLWVTCAVCLMICVINSVDSAQSIKAMAAIGKIKLAEDYLYNSVPMLGLFLGGFISLFLGTEHADGTIRNKLTVGKTRSNVYLASFFTCFTGSLILLTFWFLGSVIFLPLSGVPLEYGWGNVCLMVALLIGSQAVFSAIYTLIGNICTNKAMTVVYSLVVFGAILIASSGLYDRLCEPELTKPAMTFIDGTAVWQESTPNPLYLSGNIREIYQVLLELSPIGQGILISYVDVSHPVRMLLFSPMLTIVIVVLGILFFRKKDLK